MADLQLKSLENSEDCPEIDKNRNTQSRKWLITINNPKEKGFTHEQIASILSRMKSVRYWCMADEEGIKTHTYHTHIFVYSSGGIRFTTLKEKFPPAQLEMCRGTCLQCMEYVSKTGKWLDDVKSDTSIEGTFEEYGTLPIERQGQRNDLADLYTMVKSGMSDYDILEDMPDALMQINRLETVRQIVMGEKFKHAIRNLDVVYIFGQTGLGKTRYVMDRYGYDHVYRVTDYLHPFDGYRGQDVIVFDEFRSSLSLPDMLKYLDIYPLDLPCRYNNKVACYTKVYFTTNVSLHDQYPMEQRREYETWLAFLRRLDKVIHFTPKGKVWYNIDMVRDNWRLSECSPFDEDRL